jgi:hypothetical protein
MGLAKDNSKSDWDRNSSRCKAAEGKVSTAGEGGKKRSRKRSRTGGHARQAGFRVKERMQIARLAEQNFNARAGIVSWLEA